MKKKKLTAASKMRGRVSFRAHELQLAEAKELGIDVAEISRKALATAILHATGLCPTCGQYDKRAKK